MAQLRELPLANFTPVRFDTQVYPGVLREIGTIRERLAALRTLVGFRLAHVRLRVQLQLRLGPEDLE